MKTDRLFLNACRREPTSRTPLWLMRQAGRFMPEYRALRSKVTFLELCKNPDLAAEVTVFAARKLGVDAAIIFSDILLIVEPLGFTLSFAKDHGPVIGNPYRRKKDLAPVSGDEIKEHLSFVFDAIRRSRKNLPEEIPLIGFAGAPFTVASYIVEGGKSKDFTRIKEMMLKAPDVFSHLMDVLAEGTADYLEAQVEAGAEAIQLFDSWVGMLTLEQYRTFVFPALKKIIERLKGKAPVIYFGLNTSHLFPAVKESGADVVGIDSKTSLSKAWKALGNVALQGNLDPEILLGPEKKIVAAAKKILTEAGGRPGHIFNLGHGVLPQTPVENAVFLVETVKRLSQKKD